jgi:hypothetical protein
MMTARLRSTIVLSFWFGIGSVSAASAQSNLSTQGLGYPPGQLSTHAKTMGGSIGEADPLSPLNPASIALLRVSLLMIQAEPEFRVVTVGSQKQRTSVSRFPLFLGVLPLGNRWSVAVSASTLLDRTWETATRDSQVVGNDTIRFGRNQGSDGSISDLRVAVAFSPTPWFKVGLGGHALSGRAIVRTELVFDDTTNRFATDLQQSTISFGGNAVSIGAHTLISRHGAIGVSYRKGGGLSVRDRNVTVGSGSAPDRLGVSLLYQGIAGTVLAVRAARDDWSSLRGMAPTLSIHEGLDVGVGADVLGPTYGSSPFSVRVGGRWRTLPFSVDATPVKEQTWSGGLGFPLVRGDMQFSLGVMRASRRGGAGVSENAWTISTGFAIRP